MIPIGTLRTLILVIKWWITETNTTDTAWSFIWPHATRDNRLPIFAGASSTFTCLCLCCNWHLICFSFLALALGHSSRFTGDGRSLWHIGRFTGHSGCYLASTVIYRHISWIRWCKFMVLKYIKVGTPQCYQWMSLPEVWLYKTLATWKCHHINFLTHLAGWLWRQVRVTMLLSHDFLRNLLVCSSTASCKAGRS